MTLSSLFNSLDCLNETDDDEEDFSGLYLSHEPANNIPHCGFHSRKRAHMCSSVDENADSKRAKISMLEHASSTLQPRHGGTGAPLDETTGPTPVHNITGTDLYPTAVQFPSSASISIVAEPDRVIQTAEQSPSLSLPNSRSNSGPALAPIESENNQPKTALHEQTETVPSMEVGRSRVESGQDNRRNMSLGADDVTETGSEISSREEFGPEGDEQSASVSSGLSIRVSSAIQAEAPSDPLRSLVALAREMTHGQFSSERSSSPEILEPEVLSRRKDSTNTTHSKPYPRPHGNGFACMTGNTVPAAPCLNQALVDELSRLRDIYEAKKHEDPSNQFRVLNYTKAIRSITKHPTKITSVDQVSHLPGVGAGIAEKISEFIATGCVAKIAAQTTEDLAVGRLFQGIYGVGPQTAHSWYVRGLRTLADVRNRVDGIILSPAQELGLQYYTDLQRRMPR
ncbi:DNA polymerase lambda dna-pol-lambd-f: finger protein [Rhizoctonia solani AG-3 Rhs1AP]|uniref:DNA polymerase n=1 Tax=Rhizoctonia solani AG-3 Rhs1AP TaxID=1086054 RepID=X8IWG8_9AGAM|nr:DNA polymerase lambda dna-pol-lambd-f: finger protein [Rhizoctonia solani AG-3 Rhs1AP]